MKLIEEETNGILVSVLVKKHESHVPSVAESGNEEIVELVHDSQEHRGGGPHHVRHLIHRTMSQDYARLVGETLNGHFSRSKVRRAHAVEHEKSEAWCTCSASEDFLSQQINVATQASGVVCGRGTGCGCTRPATTGWNLIEIGK